MCDLRGCNDVTSLAFTCEISGFAVGRSIDLVEKRTQMLDYITLHYVTSYYTFHYSLYLC